MIDEPSISERVARLRQSMEQHDLAAYVVPSPDPHQSEYVPTLWRRREWISGFTGSRGTAVVTREAANLWADSRYWLQAETELTDTGYTLMREGQPDVPTPLTWLETHSQPGERIGIDPMLLTLKEWRDWTRQLERSGAELVSIESNLVDAIREGVPPPRGRMFSLPEEFSGKSVASKLEDLREELGEVRCDAHIITTLDSIAWLFNVRGSDMEYVPVTIAYAIVTATSACLFVDATKLDPEVEHHLGEFVATRPYEDFASELESLARAGARVWVDPESVSWWVAETLTGGDEGATLYEKESSILLAKAQKNEVELQGMRDCHVRDGAAVVRFLAWLEGQMAQGQQLDEVDAAERLCRFRADGELFQGESFPTISGYGPNGAIVHYGPRKESCAALESRGLYLVDSGGHYLDGTTDITRTVALGEVTQEEREHFTLVLVGHITLACARFPVGTLGGQLDSLARKPLWDAYLTYGHGTGHGVGHYLNVHEGPASISPRSIKAQLRPGMVLSNEPGYYRAGHYGIRTESLVEVIEVGAGPDGEPFLGFRELTMCPIDMRCIDPLLLSDLNREWLDDYHVRVRGAVMPLLADEGDRQWLERATRPLSEFCS